jgi:hypothetical protein
MFMLPLAGDSNDANYSMKWCRPLIFTRNLIKTKEEPKLPFLSTVLRNQEHCAFQILACYFIFFLADL